jgi:hypothetical protein
LSQALETRRSLSAIFDDDDDNDNSLLCITYPYRELSIASFLTVLLIPSQHHGYCFLGVVAERRRRWDDDSQLIRDAEYCIGGGDSSCSG